MNNNFLTKLKSMNAQSKNTAAASGSFMRFSGKERMLFIKRLAILLRAGVPILQSVNMIKDQTKTRTGSVILSQLSIDMANGQSLHDGLYKFKRFFGDFSLNLIRVGEITGTLFNNLEYLAEELKKQQALKRKVMGALIYPAIIIVATIGITVLLITYVFPKILPVLQTFKGQLPFTTRTLIFLSNLLTNQGWMIALGIVILTIIWVILLRKVRAVRLFTHKASLRIPVIGTLFKSFYMASFTRTLGILLSSGVSIVEAVRITAATSGNLAYKDSLQLLAESMTRGEKVANYFESDPALYPALISQMTGVGESTGKLSETLMYLADIYEQEVDELTKNLSTAIEPMLMVFMGLLVGFIAMSIITPIYSLTQNLSR